MKISTNLTQSNIAKTISLLAKAPETLEALCSDLTEEKLHQTLSQGEWSIQEQLAHMLYSEAVTSQAIYLAVLVDEPCVPDVHPQRDWGRLLRYDLLSFSELLSYYKMRRSMLLRVLREVSEDKWSRCVRKGERQKPSIYRLARSLALHEQDHLVDIEQALQDRTKRRSGKE